MCLPPAESSDLNNLQNLPKAPAPTPLPLPKDLSADIGESTAVQIALKIVDGKFGESNPQVVSANLMTYKEAMLLSPEPTSVPEEDPRSNMLVRVVKMEGAFQPRRGPRGATTRTFTKALIVVRAPDGLVLRSALSFD
ncbi:MAG: hypothetical protein KME08_00090 [Aphanothece sp. CMT-3BRIN-NPC111]|jgi:hypothetical protein|nr:hypothetical protein [Aphanothece sp. CMT-3BRIN-NPC111]